RGTLECSIFPKLGHAPMEKNGWRKVFQTAKTYGLNHLRFHSWCPPAAAFEVADELGFYLQIELPAWTYKIGQDKLADNFLQAEAKRIIQYYGNHPSFCFWSMGNEMQGNMQWLSDEVMALKAIDKRRLYTTTTFTFEEGFGKWPVPADDYFITQYTKKGWVRGQGIFDTEAPSFNKDYTSAMDSLPVPLITHEVGQYAVYPNMKEVSKYTGVLKPVNFIAVKNDLIKKNLLSLANDFTKASGKLAVLLYKEEIERALKTHDISGFQLLDLHDFPGQGTALVGILDAFWESKGLITPDKFREFCSSVVPLVRFQKATYTNDETFSASVEVANFSTAAIKQASVSWQIATNDKQIIAKGRWTPSTIEIGNGITLGNITASLNKISTAQKLTLTVSIENTNYTNSWNIWVYPRKLPQENSAVVFTADYTEAINALNEGKTVLLNPAKEKINGVEGKFVQVFWSPVHFPNQPGTMGLLVNPAHPAFAHFPTDEYTNWQWWDLCKNSTTLVLDSVGINPSAIVLRDIDNFFKNRNMASIIEAKVGKGKLLLCTMDIEHDLEKRPVAAQLKYSLLQYMGGNKFNPVTNLNENNLKKIIK
ncbi:glycoside hydrolase family 2 TIM barrel-domain containing protein, partial [Ferruginibacter sp.]|uniref:glycoside hydrolase family 2 TIM barrel-domain containing protein n=1 Tax=Ferruginibacter sp. TaxID=1940288 RepID=UPI0019899F25